MTEIILAVLLFCIAAAAFFMSLRSFRHKGFLLNNAYLYASKQEREQMDKTPYYRQSAVVFLLVGVIFLLMGAEVLFDAHRLFLVTMVVTAATLVYAVVSAVWIEKRQKK